MDAAAFERVRSRHDGGHIITVQDVTAEDSDAAEAKARAEASEARFRDFAEAASDWFCSRLNRCAQAARRAHCRRMDLIAFLPQFILYQLTNPFIFVPGILIGWFARTRAQLVGGGVLIAIVTTLLSFLESLPAGGQHVWGAIPLAVIAPLIWVFAVSALKRLMRPGESEAPRSGRLKLVRAIVGAVIGAPLGAAIGTGLGMAAVEIFQISAREGGAGYFVMFLFFLPGIPIGAIIGAIIGYRWSGVRKTTAP